MTPTSIEVAKHTLVSGVVFSRSERWQGLGSATRAGHGTRPVFRLCTRGGARMKTCPECNGDGVIEKGTDDEQQCPTCGGTGLVPDDADGKTNEEVIRTGREVAA